MVAILFTAIIWRLLAGCVTMTQRRLLSVERVSSKTATGGAGTFFEQRGSILAFAFETRIARAELTLDSNAPEILNENVLLSFFKLQHPASCQRSCNPQELISSLHLGK